MKKFSILPFVWAASVILAWNSPAQVIRFPFDIGNHWSYGTQWEMAIVGIVTIGQERYFLFDRFFYQDSALFRPEPDGKVWQRIAGIDYVRWDFNASVGETWAFPYGTIELQSRSDTVKVPAGTFANCYRFHYHFNGVDNDWEEWIAPGGGIVRHVLYGIGVVDYGLTGYRLSSGTNYIINGSFETSGGQSSLEGWQNYGGQPYHEAPPGGGQWSLEISGGCLWGFCYQVIPQIRKGEIWGVRCWARLGSDRSGGNFGWLIITPQGNRTPKLSHLTDTTWACISLVDTFSVGEQDSVAVVLEAGGGHTGGGWALFDLVEAERLKVISSVKGIEPKEMPHEFYLAQNYPNPFNTSTMIRFDLPQPGFVTLEIYNLRGQKVRTLVAEWKRAGSYQVNWDGKNDEEKILPSGLYIYRMKTEGRVEARKLSLLR